MPPTRRTPPRTRARTDRSRGVVPSPGGRGEKPRGRSFKDEARNLMRSIPGISGISGISRRALALSLAALPALTIPVGCSHPQPYGVEHQLVLPGGRPQVWAVAPAVNLSGMREVDAILQSDLLFQQLQEV